MMKIIHQTNNKQTILDFTPASAQFPKVCTSFAQNRHKRIRNKYSQLTAKYKQQTNKGAWVFNVAKRLKREFNSVWGAYHEKRQAERIY